MKQNKLQKGFSVIEALVAIAILSVAVAAPLTVASRGLIAAVHAKNQITAFYLAQEAVEFIRNRRDEATLSGINWLSGITPASCRMGNKCTIDVINNSFSACGFSCSPLKFNQNGSRHLHSRSY